MENAVETLVQFATSYGLRVMKVDNGCIRGTLGCQAVSVSIRRSAYSLP